MASSLKAPPLVADATAPWDGGVIYLRANGIGATQSSSSPTPSTFYYVNISRSSAWDSNLTYRYFLTYNDALEGKNEVSHLNTAPEGVQGRDYVIVRHY